MRTDEDLRAFSVAEVARRLTLSEVELRRIIRRGELRVVRAGANGRRILIPADALRDYLAPARVRRNR